MVSNYEAASPVFKGPLDPPLPPPLCGAGRMASSLEPDPLVFIMLLDTVRIGFRKCDFGVTFDSNSAGKGARCNGGGTGV